MSTPQQIRCWKCQKIFYFLRSILTKCPYCGEEYVSHRDAKGIEKEKIREVFEKSQ
jgi:rRNA maturation endonuclease Nob1